MAESLDGNRRRAVGEPVGIVSRHIVGGENLLKIGELMATALPGCRLRIVGIDGERMKYVLSGTLMFVESTNPQHYRVRVPQMLEDGGGFDVGEVVPGDVELSAAVGGKRRKFGTAAEYYTLRRKNEKEG